MAPCQRSSRSTGGCSSPPPAAGIAGPGQGRTGQGTPQASAEPLALDAAGQGRAAPDWRPPGRSRPGAGFPDAAPAGRGRVRPAASSGPSIGAGSSIGPAQGGRDGAAGRLSRSRRPPGSCRARCWRQKSGSVGGRLPVTSTTRSCGRMLGVPGWPRNAKTHPAASTPPWPPSWRMTGPPPWPALPGTASTSERATTPEATQPRGRSPDRARHAIQPGLREPMVSGGCAGDVHPTTDLPRNATDAAGVTAHDRAAALADTTPAIYA